MRQKIETYVIVTIIAALIWLYAESENVKPYPPFAVNVQFVAPVGQNLLIQPARPQRVTLSVRCATSQYAALEQMAEEGSLRVAIDADPDSPEQVVILSQKRLDETRIGDLGITITDVQPTTFDLRVERLEEVALSISPDSVVPAGVQLAAPPVIEPPQVGLFLPVSLAVRAAELHLNARIDDATMQRLEENVPQELTVPITLPAMLRDELAGFTPAINPKTARVTVTVRKQSDTYLHSSVPILILAPWTELEKYRIRIENDRRVLDQDVELTGPSDVIERIRTGQERVWAELRLTADDLESGVNSKQLSIAVPPSVRVDSPLPRVNFTITPIEGNGSTPAAGGAVLP